VLSLYEAQWVHSRLCTNRAFLPGKLDFSPSTFPVLDTSGTERISGNHFIQEDGGMSFLPACRE
jgi:hypothetical protein